MHIAYFITGHGYGHAIRSVTIASQFSTSTVTTIVSVIDDSFFRKELPRSYSLLPFRLDCGCVQSDFITVDVQRTLAEYRSIDASNDERIAALVQWCIEHNVDGIVSDCVPAAFDIADQCELPSLAVTNFSWYDVYREYLSECPGFSPLLEKIKRQYQKAGQLLALSPALPMRYFSDKIELPVIGRKGTCRKEMVHAYYDTSPKKNMALIYIGGFGLKNADWSRLAAYCDWEFFGLQPIEGAPDNYHQIDPSRFSYPDMIASVDCIFGKLGYGLVAEAMINGTPIVYPPRSRFAEYPRLEQAVHLWGGGIQMPVASFTGLEWDEALRRAEEGITCTRLPDNGAALCAQYIERHIALNLKKK